MGEYDWIGWVSSSILLWTVAVQIRKQLRAGTEGVSKWLYLGQFGAEIGFIAYSGLVRNWVFLFANAALLVENAIGLVLLLRQRRRERRGKSGASSPVPARA